jgi:hypothetical protein
MQATPPMKPSKADKEAIIREEMRRFDMNPTTFESEKYEIERDGYKGYIRRIYLRDLHGNPISKVDVEYRISLSNDFPTKKHRHSWGAYIYINEPDYLCNGTYKSISGTDYGVQWCSF